MRRTRLGNAKADSPNGTYHQRLVAQVWRSLIDRFLEKTGGNEGNPLSVAGREQSRLGRLVQAISVGWPLSLDIERTYFVSANDAMERRGDEDNETDTACRGGTNRDGVNIMLLRRRN